MNLEDTEALDAILAKIPDGPEETAEQKAPETASQEAEQQVETETTEQERVEPEETPAIEPPQTWKAELKARWNDIPKDLQPVLAQWETERNQGVNSKLNESAEVRKAAEAEKTAAAQERQRYASTLETLIQQAVSIDPVLSHAAQMKPADWDKLWSETPAQAGMLKNQIEQRVATIQNWNQQRQTLIQQATQEAQSKEEAKLNEKIPEWRDETKRSELKTGLSKLLQEQYGFKPEELSNLLDHRHVLVARDAMLYRQMMTARQTAETKKVSTTAPKVVKPGTAQGERGESRQVAALKQRAIQTGRDSDVLAALMAATKDL